MQASPKLDGASLLAEAGPIASSSKPKRTVRLFAHLPEESSSEDENPSRNPQRRRSREPEDGTDPHRQSTIRPPAGTNTTPPRVPSLSGAGVASIPKLRRASSSAQGPSRLANNAANTSGGASAAAVAPAPALKSSFRDWRNRQALKRNPSSRSSTSSAGAKARQMGEEKNAVNYRRGLVDLMDPDAHYYDTTKRFSHIDDLGSDEEDEDLRWNPIRGGIMDAMTEDTPRIPGPSRDPAVLPALAMVPTPTTTMPPPLAQPTPPIPLDASSIHDRKGWQSFLASVLSGDVLQGESVRIGEERGVDETFREDLGRSLWWQIRAKVRRRGEEDEKRRVEERRNRIVDPVLEEVESFAVKPSPGPAGLDRRLSSEGAEQLHGEKETVDPGLRSEITALDQVNFILQKLNVVETLYPHTVALRAAKPLYDSDEFQSRVDALTAWSTVVTSLQSQLGILQKWTGSDELDVTKPNTTQEKPLVGKSRYHSDAKNGQSPGDMADDSTFVERMMKEDSLQRTFDKRVFVDLYRLIANARETMIAYQPQFEEIKLPDFRYELVRLIGFPCRLIIEVLQVRLDAAAKLVDPNPMVIDDMIDNCRLIMTTAVIIKQQYEDLVAPDENHRWVIPECLPRNYDQILLEGLRVFFKLLQLKLKSNSRTIYFRETEVLEDEWEFLYQAAEAVPGGDLVVAENFCSLTYRLMQRVCKYFERQLHVPLALSTDESVKSTSHRRMSAEEVLSWYGKILDAVRMRYRKLQRFARRLTQRFDNSAEYDLHPDDVDQFLHQLRDSGHFLVYTGVFEQEGYYIFADETLYGKPDSIRDILQKVYSVVIPTVRSTNSRRASDIKEGVIDELPAEVNNVEIAPEEAEDEMAGYLLIVSTRVKEFVWWTEQESDVMHVEGFERIDFGLQDNRIRLVADGPTTRLSMCKHLFIDAMVKFDDETGEVDFMPEVVVETQAHLPAIQKQLRRIHKSTYRLTESIIESAAHVSHVLAGAKGTQDMTESWYQFASEHGKRAMVHVEPAVRVRFTRLLMRLAISWCSFICTHCDPTQRKTFRWTVSALRTTFQVTGGDNILQLDADEFELLRKSVAALISLLISHFDILGARGSMEAKRESEKVEAMRRLQRVQENLEDLFIAPTQTLSGETRFPQDRSLRITREDRVRLINELEAVRLGVTNDQHMIGQVLDEQVSEDRALVFLAASKSNIALRWQQGAYIGGGANGNVYLGFNLDSGGLMAVKEIRVQDLSNSPALYKQIRDESDVMAMLNHRNIVEYYGIEVHRDRVFIFQEYCEGGSLADQLGHGRVEDEEVIILYTLQMLYGLQYLHSRGVEHRDVKPENILIGSESTLKFVDFGAAKIIVKGNKTMAKTRAMKTKAPNADGPAAVMNSLAGTPMYMAPEVIRASEKAGTLGSADIWSMGCVVLEIATGRKPWSNLDNEWAIMFHIGIATQHPPLPEHGELSEAGIAFIERCLTLDPSERPTAAELLEDPWLQSTIQQLQAVDVDFDDNASPSVNNPDATFYDEMAKRAAAFGRPDITTPFSELSAFGETPMDGTPPDNLSRGDSG